MLSALAIGLALAAPVSRVGTRGLRTPGTFDFYADKPYDASIPRPDTTLGYPLCSRTTTFRDQERALLAIASAAGSRVKVIEYGKSWEGRPLRIYVVSTPANMARLEAIRKDNLERNHGKAADPKDPVIVWVNECIHGDETASFESAMALLYDLAASRSKRIESILDKAVVVLNPCYNPDGHERFTVYYNSIATGSPEPGAYEDEEPSAIFGRLNHYRFDMNRDRVAMSQVETRSEVAEFLRWHPQVYIDQHGQVGSYFFPPNAESENVNADRSRLDKWTDLFGRATGRAFDEQGWTYFVKSEFDLYYPGYLDAFTTLSGAIGLTNETDGGRLLATKRGDGTIVTLRDGAMKHFTAALAVAQAAVEHHDDLLAEFVDFKRKAVTGEAAGKFQRVVVEGDSRALDRMQAQLGRAGISSRITRASWSQNDAHDYWSSQHGEHRFAGPSLIIDLAQPQGQLAKALLEPGSDFEPEFTKAELAKKNSEPEGQTYPGPDDTDFYDITGWSLPFAYGLHAWWCESAPALPGVEAGSDPTEQQAFDAKAKSTVGYAIRYRDQDDILLAADALKAGLRVEVTTRPMRLGGQSYPRGTFLVLASRNREGFETDLLNLARKRDSAYFPLVTSYPDLGGQGPGSESILALREPKIGVVFGNGANLAEVGGIWYLMDQEFHLPFTPLSSGSLDGNLNRYSCIVVPEGTGLTMTPKLREWISGGGCLVALGGINWLTGVGGVVDLQAVGGDHEDLPGSLFRAQLDPDSFLGYGYGSQGKGPIDIAVPVEGSSFLKARPEGGSVVTFSDDDKVKKLLSGWSWPDDTEKGLAGSVWLQDVNVGRGHAILFTFDPTSRAMWPGLYKMLLNAMIVGPTTS
ncbi:MAG TPA: M14 family zinc carboxypeptidase [Fimbriimonadaceae bacterium]|nr:M14 family zinc carboxypeptidase [Fimbriimonadaceae bacterium]